MQHLILVLPLLIPLYGAILCLFFWRKLGVQRVIGVATQLSLCAASAYLLSETDQAGILTTHIGNWEAPFGITLVADLFSSLMVVASAVVGIAVFVFSLRGLSNARLLYGYYPLLLLLQMGVNGVCLTGDLFNLYVWFEVLLICCFVLIALGGSKPQLEGSIKYVTINFLASSFLLIGIGMVYGILGSLNMAELAVLIRAAEDNHGLITLASVFFLIGLGIKSAIFPLFFWLPASYHTPPIAISAFIAGLITKVGLYTLIRLFTLLFVLNQDIVLPLLLVASGLTMVVGVLGAAAQVDFRKILSFHIVSQIGYMLMGLAIFTPLAIAGSIYFIIHNILVKTCLFLISGVVYRTNGSFTLKNLGGVYLFQPLLAAMFVIAAFSLAGIPPLSGFWGKFMLAKAGLEVGQFGLVATSLSVSILTIFSMTKIWNEVFWKKRPRTDVTADAAMAEINVADKPVIRLLHLPVLFLVLAILFIGLYAEPLVSLAFRASEQLLNSEIYINAVLLK
ncbi:proton-conducting transporter transmembrane domain-containing protein [Pontibacter beigongshangensis]|uniref:proton-conducting transporter transmembrane domain-containing protein n=1 Tax=Pontibacter beigongshangensis TaxID=2574733 RepID=UPI0016507E38|nr:proton-conducting transporter membrane subunit [Pontibacter beigongshangensis]